MTEPEDVLLTFTGYHDPYYTGLIDKEDQPGPIISLLGQRSFDQVFLFDTPSTRKNTEKTREAVLKLDEQASVQVLETNLYDPTCYPDILREIKKHFFHISKTIPTARYFIAVASGTPQMHACWILLAASGEIPARILHTRPPRFVTSEKPVVSEIDLSSGEFPEVRFCKTLSGDEDKIDIEMARKKLGIIGDHPALLRPLEAAAMLARSNAPILIAGATGSGKELFARFVHILSGRPRELFFTVNCAAMPADLVESLLFGHKKGAFTGAVKDQAGKFTAANNGTLFLDELGDLPLAAQAKLLRVLQDGIVEPLGLNKGIKVDVRVVAATNKDLRKLVRRGEFREDLFYRLNVGEIILPSLGERRSDIPKLALFVLDKLNRSMRHPKRLTSEALLRLQSLDWPGNVRDLENVLERSARLTRKAVLDADDLIITEPVRKADLFQALPQPGEGFSLEALLGSTRKQMILKALEMADGNQSKAARLLGVSPQAVHKFLQHLAEK